MFIINNDFAPESFLNGTEFSYNGKFKKLFDSLNIFNLYYSETIGFHSNSYSYDRIFSLGKNGETFEFLFSPVLNGTLFHNNKGISSPISFEKMIEEYTELSNLEAVLKMYAILKIANVNPLNELKSYFDYKIAQQQELIIREKISITSLKLETILQEEFLKVSFFDGAKYFIVHFKPFLKSHIYYNSPLASLVVFPGFLDAVNTDRRMSEEEMKINSKINSFVQCSRMKVLEVMVHHYFTSSKEYKMRALYDGDFAYWWKIRLK
jgi:hypothetical protein